MRSRPIIALGMTTVLAGGGAAFLAHAGPLTPPAGPVTPTGRFSPRIEINATNTPGDADSLYKITQPGSYYLGGDVIGDLGKHGIEIDSAAVTLDLMGFTVLGSGLSLNGIQIADFVFNVSVRNGVIADWGGDGIAGSEFTGSCSFQELHVLNNAGAGLNVGFYSLIKNCQATDNVAEGIRAFGGSTIEGNTVARNEGDGMFTIGGTTITDNTARDNMGAGISDSGGSTISRNTVLQNGFHGIVAGQGSTVLGNTVAGNTGDGIIAFGNGTISDNTCSYNTANGITTGERAVVSNCNASFNGTIGINAQLGATIIDCVANDNSSNGIQLADDASAIGCSALNNNFDGIHCFAGATVDACKVANNGRDGVRATMNGVTIRETTARSNTSKGFNVNGAGCLVVNNYSTGHPTNYDLTGGSLFGPIVTSATIGANTNPSANYEGP